MTVDVSVCESELLMMIFIFNQSKALLIKSMFRITSAAIRDVESCMFGNLIKNNTEL